MTMDASAALWQAIKAQLTLTGSELWGVNVCNKQAPQNTPRPYVIFQNIAMTEPLWTKKPGRIGLIMVKCVANNLGDALNGKALIANYLHDSGVMDGALVGYGPPARLSGLPDWNIATVTLDMEIDMVENVENLRQIFHQGYRFKIRMERV